MTMNLEFGCENIDSAVSYCYFFGAYCALYGIKDNIIILHTPSGCQRRILYLWSMHDNSNEFKTTLSTNLIDKDVIFGTENKLKKVLEDTKQRYKSNLISVITSCAPEIVGIDYNLALDQIKTSSKILALNTPGFRGDFYEGFKDALDNIIRSIPKKEENIKDPKKVNIIGYLFSRYEEDEKSNIKELKSILDQLGLTANSIFFSGENFENLEKFSEAEYNVIFPYGEKSAEYLEKEIGQKNIFCDLPLGLEKTIEFIRKVAKVTGKIKEGENLIEVKLRKTIPKIQNSIHRLTGRKIALVADEQSILSFLPTVLEFGLEVKIIGIYNDTKQSTLSRIQKIIFENNLGDLDFKIIPRCNRKQIKDAIKNTYIDFCIASSIESRDLDELGVNVLEYSFPLFEKHYSFSSPTLGFSGVENLVTKMFNIVNKKFYRREAVLNKLNYIKIKNSNDYDLKTGGRNNDKIHR